MKIYSSLRFILSIIFIVSIIFPLGLTLSVVSSYYRSQMAAETVQNLKNTLESVSDNIMTYLADLETLATLPYANKDIMNALISKSEATGGLHDTESDRVLNEILLRYLKVLRKEILSIVIINTNGSVLYYNRNQNVSLRGGWDFQSNTWYRRARETDGKIFYVGAHIPSYFTFSEPLRVFSLVRMIKHPYIPASPWVILVDADTELFREMFSDLRFGLDSSVYLLDNEKNILYASEVPEDVLIKGIRENAQFIRKNRTTYSVVYKTVPTTDWKIAVLVSDAEINEKIRLFYITGLLAAAMTLLATYFVFQFLTRRYIVRPVRDMTRVIKAVEEGNLDARCSPRGNNEISSLGHDLNNMVVELGKLITREYKLVISQKKAEYRALQAHIQPHFLYNTLNGFIGLNRLGEKQLLEESILNLTGMLRYSLGSDGANMSTIFQEFDFIDKYCRLQKIRFEDRLEVSISCDKEAGEFRIPRLLIQPLVENAVIYNLDEPNRICRVHVAAERRLHPQPSILISIRDNGIGFDPDLLNGSGTGIQNVRERLKMSFPGSDFALSSHPGEGTEIRISISPLEGIRSENEDPYS